MKRLLSGIILTLLVVSMLASTFTVGTSKLVNTGVNDKTQKSNQYSQTLSEPPSTEWNKTYGETGDGVSSVVQTDDGGFALAGDTESYGAGASDAWLVKTDANGNMQWNKAYGGTDYDKAWSMIRTSDGGYMLAGYTASFGAGGCDAWLVKTDANGNMQWNKAYGGTDEDLANSVIQTNDGGYAFAGSTRSYGAGGSDAWLVKTDVSGNIQWSRTFGGTDDDSAGSIVQSSDGGYALAGSISLGTYRYGAWLVKTDANGNEQWDRTYGETDFSKACSVIQTADGGYALTGTYTGSNLFPYFWLVKTDTNGNMQWNKAYDGIDYGIAQSVIQTSEGGYALAGSTESLSSDYWDARLVKTDANGNMQWNIVYSMTGYDFMANSVVQTSDGGYAVAGSKDSSFWLAKVAGASPTYDITFTESGLAQGTQWSVTFNGHPPESSTSSSITFSAPNGVYPFSITPPTGYAASPSSGSVTVNGAAVTEPITFSSAFYTVSFTESGLAPGALWSVHFEGQYISDTLSSTSSSITFIDILNGIYDYSIAATGFIALPTSGSVNVAGLGVTVAITFSIVYVNTTWNNLSNSYAKQWGNPGTTWSSNGNCYGLTSTAVLYFMHYTLNYSSYPYFPSQNPQAASTSDLDLSGFENTGWIWPNSILNNASLAIMFHQCYGQDFAYFLPFDGSEQQQNYGYLIGNLTVGQPVILCLGTGTNSNPSWPHAVVAWGVGPPQGSDPALGVVAIYLYDPNCPQTTQVATYNLVTETFSYLGYNKFLTACPSEIQPGSPANPFRYPSDAERAANWLNWSVAGYYIVVIDCHSKMAMLQTDDLKQDYFNELGNSTSFVCGIPGSSGIEEGGYQVYAIPTNTNFYIFDPGSDQSTIWISRVDNESGQFFDYGYLLNATTTQGLLNYTATPLGSGLSISAGDNALNATVTCFSATQQGYSVSDVMTAQIDAGQSANLTAPCLASFTTSKTVVGKGYSVPVNVTITNSGNNPENVSLTLYANGTALDSEMVYNLLNGTSVNLVCVGNTSSCEYGNYGLSVYCQPNGINEAANNFTSSWVVVSIKGDLTGGTPNALDFVPDGKVDIVDVAVVAKCFGQKVPPAPANCDVSGSTVGVPDGKIDITDVATVAKHYGEHYP